MGQSVEWVLHNVSTLELAGWAKYYGYLHQQSKRK
jgi:CRISPR/Cas system-associated endonuclease Cas1